MRSLKKRGKMKKVLLIISIYFLTTLNAFAEFSFTFEWGDIKKCT